MKKFRTKETLPKKKEIDLQQRELVVLDLSIKGEKGWTKFQELLGFSEKDRNYWDREETQKELTVLGQFIERIFWKIQEFKEEDIKINLKNFLLREDQEGFNVSWDSPYCLGYYDSIADLTPLYPEDIFEVLINLDRAILFCREENRKRKYEIIKNQINLINNALIIP